MKRRIILSLLLMIGIVLSLSVWQKKTQNSEKTETLPQNLNQTEESVIDDETENAHDDIGSEDTEAITDVKKKGHWETITVTEPAWDESVLIKEGWTETILVKDAWDEEDTYCSVFGQDSYSGYECNCRKVSGTLEEVMKHVEEDENCNSWHSKTIYYGEPYCQAYKTDYIHHDAQYRTIYHDPEYRIIHHESRTYEKQVWIEE